MQDAYVNESEQQNLAMEPFRPMFITIPEEDLEIIQNTRAELRTKTSSIVNRESSIYGDPFTETKKQILICLCESSIEGKAYSRIGVTTKVSEEFPEMDFRTDQVKELINQLSRTRLEVEMIMDSQRVNNRRHYYYLKVRKDIELISKDDAFLEPIQEMSEYEWESLPLLLEAGIQTLNPIAYILKEILFQLKIASERQSSVTKEYIIQKIFQKTKTLISEDELTQSIDYASIIIKDRFDNIGFKILEKGNLLQAGLSKDLEEIDDDLLIESYDATGELKGEILEGIELIDRHMNSYRDYPIIELLMFMVENRPCTSIMIVNFFKRKKIKINSQQIYHVVRRIRNLNNLYEDYSPIKINIYGKHQYYIGRSKKIYLEGLGDYSSRIEEPVNSVYPCASNIIFNYSYFIQTLEKKLPFLVIGESKMALLVKVISSFSAMQFKVSFPIILNILKSLDPETKIVSTRSLIPKIKNYLLGIYKETGISIKYDEEGYSFETENHPSPIAQRFNSWPDYVNCEGSAMPYEFIENNEELFREPRQSPVNNLAPELRARIAHWKEKLPYEFANSDYSLSYPFEINHSNEMKEKLVNEAILLASGKITKKRNSAMKEINQAILYALLCSTLKGEAIFSKNIEDFIGSQHFELIKFDTVFKSLRKIINDSKHTPMRIVNVKIPSRLKMQNVIYYLDFKEENSSQES